MDFYLMRKWLSWKKNKLIVDIMRWFLSLSDEGRKILKEQECGCTLCRAEGRRGK